MVAILDGLEVIIRDGKCNVWIVSAYEVEIHIGEPGCIEIYFRTEWEKGKHNSESIYQAQVPITKEAHKVCFAMVFEGLYPKVAEVGLVICDDSDIFPDNPETYWAKEYRNGDRHRGGR